MNVLGEIRKKWFLIGVASVIACAKLGPFIGAKGGPLKPEITIKYIAVSIIFFNSGLSLKTEELTRAVGQIRLHTFIQSYTLVFIPTAMTLLSYILDTTNFIDDVFVKGLHVVGCMPPPVSSAVILTKAVGGNEAGAIFNSALGSFLGIFLTPLLLLVLVGTPATIPIGNIFIQLSMTVLVPLVVGQIVHYFFKHWLEEHSIPYGTISSSILLMIIYTTFCDTFQNTQSEFSPVSVLKVIIIVFLCQCLFLSLAYIFTNVLGVFSRHDVIAVLFCSTHKSLTLGIPILKILYGQSPDLSSISLPLLIYHPTQILLGSFLVPWLQQWVSGASGVLPNTIASTAANRQTNSPVLGDS